MCFLYRAMRSFGAVLVSRTVSNALMKSFLIPVLVSFAPCNLAAAQTSEPLLHEYMKGKSILLYSYAQRHDSTFLIGRLKERRSGQPVSNINILVKEFRVGTVPDSLGNFSIFLPVKQGVITFDKPGYGYFEFPFKYAKEDPKRPTAHH